MGILDMEERTSRRVVLLCRSRWWLDSVQPQRAHQLPPEHVWVIDQDGLDAGDPTGWLASAAL